jgi:hypothetical protein
MPIKQLEQFRENCGSSVQTFKSLGWQGRKHRGDAPDFGKGDGRTGRGN